MSDPGPAPIVCVPVKVDAYSLDSTACKDFPNSTLAPITQPNYTFLRLDPALVRPDVLPFHDLHYASPAAGNPRVTNIPTGTPRLERQGVYLHWMVPRYYRSGSTEDTLTKDTDMRPPRFRTAPDRWLVLRKLDVASILPSNVIKDRLMREVTAWVIESNRVREIEEFGKDVDIELECAPYIIGGINTDSLTDINDRRKDTIEKQAEIFIGQKSELARWTERRTQEPDKYVPLDVLGAANPMFADYTPHNTNVFSILDNFHYHQSDGPTQYLTQATASYYVLGWHSNPAQDPLSISEPQKSTLSSILASLKIDLKLPPGEDPQKPSIDIDTWKSTRIVCHGAMYNVSYSAGGSPGRVCPADDAARKVADEKSHPVTIAETSLKTIVAHLRAHVKPQQSASAPSVAALENAESDLYHLQTLLLQQDETVDGQQQAKDMLSSNNFRPARDSGSHWSFSAAYTGQNAEVSRTTGIFTPNNLEIEQLARLNAAQSALDSVERELQLERWNHFSLWWKFIADTDWKRRMSVKIHLPARRAKIKLLQMRAANLRNLLEEVCLLPFPVLDDKGTRKVAKGSQDRFYSQKDPELLIPGMANPWPNDWMENIQGRLSPQIGVAGFPRSQDAAVGWDELDEIMDNQVPQRLPHDLTETLRLLIREFRNYLPTSVQQKQTDAESSHGEDLRERQQQWTEHPSKISPTYHDHVQPDHSIAPGLSGDMQGRDQWSNTQGWFPLFMEWEIHYYHLPWQRWSFDERGYKIYADRWFHGWLDKAGRSARVLTGRIPIVPQVGSMLSRNIQQLFLSTPEKDLPAQFRDQAARSTFLAKVLQLDYLSAPMAGFYDHFATKLNGTHIRPSVRVSKKPIAPLKAAFTSSHIVGFTEEDITLMDLETNLIPYADHVEVSKGVAAFKPVVHGQFRFKKLNIIDKFGQVISGIDPSPTAEQRPFIPSSSEYLHPARVPWKPNYALCVTWDDYNHCSVLQSQPAISQDARINASYMHYDEQRSIWRPCTEWENPIWGYILVNHAEYALQVFLPDGQFYREARLGGPLGVFTSPKWQPFEMPKDRDALAAHPQLDRLLEKFEDADYLRSFAGVIDRALDSVAYTPDMYADHLNAIVGRPLALTNMGFSLELSHPPLKDESFHFTDKEPYELVDNEYFTYSFSIKIGSKDRVFDGLVGYFEPSKDPKIRQDLNLDVMHTYFGDKQSHTMPIQEGAWLKASAYHISCADKKFDFETISIEKALKLTRQLEEEHWKKLQMLGVLVDPFTSLHLYSGILPIKSLKLPQWAFQSALQKMTAFFHMGPMIITTPNLQSQYNPDNNLKQNYNFAEDDSQSEEVESKSEHTVSNSLRSSGQFKGIPIPALKSADWAWLQPFARRTKPSAPSSTGQTSLLSSAGGLKPAEGSTADQPPLAPKEQHWNAFPIDGLDNAPKFEPGPYTAVEGYLQLKKPIMTAAKGQSHEF